MLGGCRASPNTTNIEVLTVSTCTNTPTVIDQISIVTETIPTQYTTSYATKQQIVKATPTPLPQDFWKKLPVIPDTISDRVREIYKNGLELGNNPQVFSKIGDCNSSAPAFLVGFDNEYELGDYSYLQPTISYFQGSFERSSFVAKGGMNSSGLLTTLWANEKCAYNETPLDCQYRLDKPSFAIISIGTNEGWFINKDSTSFERNMRIIIEGTINKGIVPILATKADNLEGDNSVNETLARLAMEYEIPLWNFWAATQPLPDHGLRDSNGHLNSISYTTFTDFTMYYSLECGMQIKNLTALQMLDFLRKQLASTSLSNLP